MDTYAVCSLAQIRILLVPVGGISPSKFEECAREIRGVESIRLDDIPADNKDERARFMPNSASLLTGRLHLAFPSHPPPHAHYPLSLLRPSHFPMAVIGVAASASTDSLSPILANFNTTILDIFPTGSLFPLARTCFVFEEGDNSTNLNTGHDMGLVVIPSMMGNKRVYISTRIADLCAHILGEFGVLVQTLESPLGNEYLNSSVLPTLPPPSEMPSPLEVDSRRESLPPLPTHASSQPEVSRGSFILGSAPTMKKNSSAGPFRSSTLGPASSAKKRQSGIGVASSPARLFKMYGDFYLLAGRTQDAEQWYTESVSIFKTMPDSVWQASASESLSIIPLVDAWATFHSSHSNITSNEPWLDIVDKISSTRELYHRIPSDGEQDYALLSLLYCHNVLRQANLLFSVWFAKGWGSVAFSAMLHSGPSPYTPPGLQSLSDAEIDRLSSVSQISRNSISNAISQIHGPWLLHLDPRERISVLETTASLYASIRYRRKEAYILREVLGCVLDLIVCGREEDGLQVTTSASGFSPQLSVGMGPKAQIGIRYGESGEGNASLIKVLKYLCRTLGIDLDAVSLVDSDRDGTQPVPDPMSWYNEELAEGSRMVIGWPELQIGVIREAVAVAEALPDFPTVAQFALSALKTLQTILTSNDQLHFYATAARSLLTTQRRGLAKSVSFWSGRPIVSIALAPLQPIFQALEKPLSALRPKSDVVPILMGVVNPFLYNPRQTSSQGSSLVIQNETLEFEIVLQNPFAFDLEIQSLRLSTTGVKFESQPIKVVIPANNYHTLLMTGCALETGKLTVRGCIVQCPGGQPREFVLPLATDAEEERLARRREALACEADRFKYSGLECLVWNRKPERTSAIQSLPITFHCLECKVIPMQPLMRIRRTSVTHGALMLYEGEMATLILVLENISTLPVDFIRLAFDDSTISAAQQALAEGVLNVFDTYETEYDLIHRPLFSTELNSACDVRPGHKVVIRVQCMGKVGCTNGTITVSYGLVDRPDQVSEAKSEYFHVRQLVYPVIVTVYPMLDCSNMNLIPLSESHLFPDEKYSGIHPDEWSLFSVEVQNVYGQPFKVWFELNEEDESPFDSSTTLPPGATSRILFPIHKFRLPLDQVHKPIPTLSERQFVVAKSKLSTEEENLQRELFWYREELFKRVRGKWQEVGGVRHGDLSLRRQRMTLPMLETLRTPTVKMNVSAHEMAGDRTYESLAADKFALSSHKLIQIVWKVTNMSAATLGVTFMDIRVTPIEHTVYQGVLTNQPLGCLESGESAENEIVICFLANGEYRVDSQVLAVEAQGGRSVLGSHSLSCAVDSDR